MPPKKQSGKTRKRTVRDRTAVRVKTGGKLKDSSKRWLERQLNDPYVREAVQQGYRSRAAFKLKEMNEKLQLIKPGMVVLDLGAAPGGWTQVAVECGARKVIGLDILPMEPVPGATLIEMDFMSDEAPEALIDAVGEGADIVLSDMAPNTTGHRTTDHLRIMALAEAAYDFAGQVLKPGGAFVCKVFQGGAQNELLQVLKKDFVTVKHVKPPASRKESSESYVVASGFRGMGAV